VTHGTAEPEELASAAQGVAGAMAVPLEAIATIFEKLVGGEGPEPTPEQRIERARAQEEAAQAARQATAARDDDTKAKRRHDLLREFGREIPNDLEADIERGRDRDRREERSR
jgi:hypothetical protein